MDGPEWDNSQQGAHGSSFQGPGRRCPPRLVVGSGNQPNPAQNSHAQKNSVFSSTDMRNREKATATLFRQKNTFSPRHYLFLVVNETLVPVGGRVTLLKLSTWRNRFMVCGNTHKWDVILLSRLSIIHQLPGQISPCIPGFGLCTIQVGSLLAVNMEEEKLCLNSA